MIKLLKWIYNLGIHHERRRIKLLIAEHRDAKPEAQQFGESGEKEYLRQLDLWYAVDYELQKLLSPSSSHNFEAMIDDDYSANQEKTE